MSASNTPEDVGIAVLVYLHAEPERLEDSPAVLGACVAQVHAAHRGEPPEHDLPFPL
ncbi:MAG: hypothetical protein M3N00_01695 [Actinomycetota bacterium]|nr:hypothetical protein [Actinomycetota bacterium]